MALVLALMAVGLWMLLRPAPGISPVVGHFPVRGVDVSAHNGDVDFARLREHGIEFAYIKATEGVSFKDAMFERNIAAARRAGLKVGAYHFFRFDSPAYMQALNVAQSLRQQPLDLPVVIDIEQWTNPTGHSADSVLHRAGQMAKALESQGYKVMFYTNKRGQLNWIRHELKQYPLWLCSLTDLGGNSRECAMWQYSHTGHIPGVKGSVDLNVFCGSREQWNDWVKTHQRQQ